MKRVRNIRAVWFKGSRRTKNSLSSPLNFGGSVGDVVVTMREYDAVTKVANITWRSDDVFAYFEIWDAESPPNRVFYKRTKLKDTWTKE